MRSILILFLSIATTIGSCTSSPKIGETYYGSLAVPENRNDPDSREIEIAFARIPSKTSTSKPPIVFIQGGPGGSSLVMVPFFEASPLREDHDIILFDARGTGDSDANCKDAGQKFTDLMRQDLTVEEEYEGTLAICAACKDELDRKGVDLAGYNSIENAADLEALRKHLKIDKWVLFGGSYGTRLGLTYLRDYDAAEAAVFMGLFPLEANIYNELVGGFDAALQYLFDRCENDPRCSKKYPNLKADFVNLIADLREAPKKINYRGDEFTINAQDALLLVHQMLYDKESVQLIPAFVEAMNGDGGRILTSAMDRTAYTMSFINSATYWSVQATEEVQFNETNAIEESIQEFSYLSPAPSFFVSDQRVLDQWHSFRSDERENKKVITDTPILIVSGLFDPITPVANARAAADYLPKATLVEFANDGHTIFNDCFHSIMVEFLHNNYEVTDSSCSQEGSLRWK